MKITILCVGKVKEKFYRDAISEYQKRLGRYCRLQIIEVADEKTIEQASVNEINIVKEKEGERLIKNIKDDAYVICLAIDGKQIDYLALKGKSHICFIIGGSLGLSDEVLKLSDLKLSFSKMTFPHQLMRVILLEQIYRSYRISNNEPYHK